MGGCDKVIELYSNGTLSKLLLKGTQERDQFDPGHSYDYDVIVIGGGSGGLSCAKVHTRTHTHTHTQDSSLSLRAFPVTISLLMCI